MCGSIEFILCVHFGGRVLNLKGVRGDYGKNVAIHSYTYRYIVYLGTYRLSEVLLGPVRTSIISSHGGVLL